MILIYFISTKNEKPWAIEGFLLFFIYLFIYFSFFIFRRHCAAKTNPTRLYSCQVPSLDLESLSVYAIIAVLLTYHCNQRHTARILKSSSYEKAKAVHIAMHRPRVAQWLERPLGVREAGVRSPTASHQRRKNCEVCASQLGAWH